jgi:hypothetical protein
MVSREIWINIFGRVLFEVFEKLTRACYIQIALETMLLPILNKFTHGRVMGMPEIKN